MAREKKKDDDGRDATGRVKLTPFRLEPIVLAELDAIADHHGLANRTAAIRYLSRKETMRIAKEQKS